MWLKSIRGMRVIAALCCSFLMHSFLTQIIDKPSCSFLPSIHIYLYTNICTYIGFVSFEILISYLFPHIYADGFPLLFTRLSHRSTKLSARLNIWYSHYVWLAYCYIFAALTSKKHNYIWVWWNATGFTPQNTCIIKSIKKNTKLKNENRLTKNEEESKNLQCSKQAYIYL